MRIVKDFPCKVNITEHVWIKMRDGVRLSARVWVPEGAEEKPVPAIFEYIPYRKRDNRRTGETTLYGYFSGHGYACVRVDIRGSGDSEGVLEDEYTPQELEDGCEILNWIGRQPWCDGNVGMIGISWGGFNGLQLAALQPPELKTIITVCSTDDRYADDVHYMGGCLLNDNLSWSSIMFAYNSLPPDPEIVGEKWRDMWRQRLEGSGLWIHNWTSEQTRSDFWKHGSVCENFDDIKCPVMAVSGWADGYSNSVFRLMENLSVPRQGLIGPWSHTYPQNGIPGPAIGFLQEAVQWWDHWLKGEDNGIMAKQPQVRAWMQDPAPPQTSYDIRPGRWVGEESWPTPTVKKQTLHMAPGGRLARTAPEDATLELQSPVGLGYNGGKWCSYAASPDLPGDQRFEDGGALVFETETLGDDVEILGAPALELDLEADREVAMVAARLSCVLPDGSVTRVTYGLLNLTHRNSHETPEPLVPGKRYKVKLQLNDIAQRFAKGHKIRIALSSSYWPQAWLPPKPVKLTFHTEGCKLLLPVRPPQKADENLPVYGAPETGPLEPVEICRERNYNWQVTRDLRAGTTALEVKEDDGAKFYPEINLTIDCKVYEKYSHRGEDFTSAQGETCLEYILEREGWRVHTTVHTQLTADETHFHIKAKLEAYENGEEFYTRDWDLSVKRNLV